MDSWVRMRLSILNRSISEDFPSTDNFGGSHWWAWMDRIRVGQKAEEDRLHWLLAGVKDKNKEEYAEWLSEDYHEACAVTNNMCAALVVSIWSRAEHSLNFLLRTQLQGLHDIENYKRTTFLKTIFGNLRRRLVNAKKDKKAPAKEYKFKEIKRHFRIQAGIDLRKLPGFPEVNATRIVNNAYKHNNGRYGAKENIDQLLMNRWNLSKDEAIPYSTLPIEEILNSFNAFFAELTAKVDEELTRKEPLFGKS